jgi:hypothetical protein
LTNPRGREVGVLRWPDAHARREPLDWCDIANGRITALHAILASRKLTAVPE